MSTLLVAAAYASSLDPEFVTILKKIPENVRIGEGVVLINPDTGAPWLAYDSPGWSLDDVAYCGWALEHQADVLDAMEGDDEMEFIQEEVRELATSMGVVMPNEIAGLGEAGNPWQVVLEAQGVNDSEVKMASQVPDGWTAPPPEL